MCVPCALLRLSGSPLSDITGWVINYAAGLRGGVGSGATGPSPFTLFIALTLCVKHINTCVTFVKFCELGYVAGDVAGWV